MEVLDLVDIERRSGGGHVCLLVGGCHRGGAIRRVATLQAPAHGLLGPVDAPHPGVDRALEVPRPAGAVLALDAADAVADAGGDGLADARSDSIAQAAGPPAEPDGRGEGGDELVALGPRQRRPLRGRARRRRPRRRPRARPAARATSRRARASKHVVGRCDRLLLGARVLAGEQLGGGDRLARAPQQPGDVGQALGVADAAPTRPRTRAPTSRRRVRNAAPPPAVPRPTRASTASADASTGARPSAAAASRGQQRRARAPAQGRVRHSSAAWSARAWASHAARAQPRVGRLGPA